MPRCNAKDGQCAVRYSTAAGRDDCSRALEVGGLQHQLLSTPTSEQTKGLDWARTARRIGRDARLQSTGSLFMQYGTAVQRKTVKGQLCFARPLNG